MEKPILWPNKSRLTWFHHSLVFEFGRMLQLFAVISSTFQWLLLVGFSITISTAQLQPRSAVCFISLIKSLNWQDCLNILQSYPLFSSNCSSQMLQIESRDGLVHTHDHSQHTLHCWQVLVLLVSRQLIMMSSASQSQPWWSWPTAVEIQSKPAPALRRAGNCAAKHWQQWINLLSS